MTPHDRFWRFAIRSAYLTSIEQAGLRHLLARFAVLGPADQRLLLNEGTPYVEPFTLEMAYEWAERLAQEEL